MASVTYSNKLEDQAASAALNPHKEQRRPSVLDEDGKLSSASAATSLKYAQAQDLPSFPSAGLKMSSAGAAASLADSNKKSFEHWKPGSIPAANRAALLAKDYEMDPQWQPELSAAGSKAALLAHRDAGSVNIWKPQSSEQGQSAAGQALKTKSPSAIHDRNVPPDVRQKALMAATGAMASSRPRSGSLPSAKGANTNWALKAATSSQKGVPNSGPFASGDPGFEAARIQNLAKNNVNRQLYGSTPPVAIEVEERNRQAMLQASAVAMAKKMYAIQQSHIDEAAGVGRNDSTAAATKSHRRNLSGSSSGAGDASVAGQTPRYENLEEAARKLAQERLAKIHDEHAEYRQYYGAAQPTTRSRLSMRLRRRASTGGRDDDSSEDEEQSRRIRKQMSLFQSKLADVDKKKQQADRDALLEAAHRNVEARMAAMDEKVFQQTGKASPAQRELWEQQARERAQKSSETRMANVGKVHIGGGKYLDQAEVDAIARARLQPTLDEIHDTAEKQRARDTEIRLEHERTQEQMRKEKERDAEAKAEVKAAERQAKMEAKKKKEEEKQASKEQATADKEARKAEENAEKERSRKEKEAKQAEIAAEKEKARLENEQKQNEAAADKEEKRKSTDGKPGRFNSLLKRRSRENPLPESEAAVAAAPAAAVAATAVSDGEAIHTSDLNASVPEGDTIHDRVTVPSESGGRESGVIISPPQEASAPVARASDESPASPTSPTSPSKRESKVKSWFKSLKGSSKAAKEEPESETLPVTTEGADPTRDESIREVAMAGREAETDDLYGGDAQADRPVSPIHEVEDARASKASSISSYSADEAAVEQARPLSGTEHTATVGHSGLKAKLMKKVRSRKDPAKASFVTSKSDDEHDEFEEAKDRFDDDKVVVPPSLSNSNAAVSPQTSQTSHEHSKFKEEL